MFLQNLISMLIGMGWYVGKPDLLTLKIEGEFEGFYGKASESWEHRFSLEISEIHFDGKEFPGFKAVGVRHTRNFEDLAMQAIKFINNFYNKEKE